MNGSAGTPPAAGGSELSDRVRRLEAQLAALTDAVETLARGLESSPLAEPNGHIEETARRTHELLLLAKSAAAGGGAGGAAASG